MDVATPHAGIIVMGCHWWNLVCQGGHQVANAGLSAITKSIASGASTLLSEIVKVVDESSTVPLEDPTYRDIYVGFLGLAVPVVAFILFIALIQASVRRDAGTLGRAVVGVGVASLGGALYIVFAQLLVALDDSLAHGIVRVTGHDLTNSINELAMGFDHVAGDPGEMAANMLLILLMLIMLVSGLVLWFVLVLRKVAILVVVAFAPLLIAGYLWAPTRSWVRKATEVLVALVFTKSAIFALFGIGLALLARGTDQSLSDFVGETVLMCGACFAPLLMLRLVHFAADTHLAGDAMGTLRGGVQPVADRIHRPHRPAQGRNDFARSQGQAPRPDSSEPARPIAGPTPTAPEAAPAGVGAPAGGAGSGAKAAGGTGAAGAAAGVVGGVAAAGGAALQAGQQVGSAAGGALSGLQRPAGPRAEPDPTDRAIRGPYDPFANQPSSPEDH